jgi:hypothetical protein
MIKKPIEHTDKLGKQLIEGACVAFAASNSLMIGTVKKLHPKQISVMPFGKYNRSYHKYPTDVVVVNGPEVSIFLLKNSG